MSIDKACKKHVKIKRDICSRTGGIVAYFRCFVFLILTLKIIVYYFQYAVCPALFSYDS